MKAEQVILLLLSLGVTLLTIIALFAVIRMKKYMYGIGCLLLLMADKIGVDRGRVTEQFDKHF